MSFRMSSSSSQVLSGAAPPLLLPILIAPLVGWNRMPTSLHPSHGASHNARNAEPDVQYITLHYITLHYVMLRYITLRYVTLYYITLHYITLHYITLHYITLHYITVQYRILLRLGQAMQPEFHADNLLDLSCAHAGTGTSCVHRHQGSHIDAGLSDRFDKRRTHADNLLFHSQLRTT